MTGVLVCFAGKCSSSKWKSTLEGNNLLLQEQIIFLQELTHPGIGGVGGEGGGQKLVMFLSFILFNEL